ncbi:MAG: fibronectin type III-like domain-contianing protein [Betaproteobacteria bacterium]|nr:fibronectin type III-like domain-contianing protein [Betaproteobacteria bacterium]
MYQPTRQLRGFAKVALAPGEEKTVTLTLTRRDFAYWDVRIHDWAVQSGTFEVHVGGSSRDLPLHVALDVTARHVVYPKLTRDSLLKSFQETPGGKVVFDEILHTALAGIGLAGELTGTPEEIEAKEKSRAMITVFIQEMQAWKLVAASRGAITEEGLQTMLDRANAAVTPGGERRRISSRFPRKAARTLLVRSRRLDSPIERIEHLENLPLRAFVHSVRDCASHHHRDCEFLLCLQGQVVSTRPPDETRLGPDDLFFVHPHELHLTRWSSGTNLLAVLQTDAAFAARLDPDFMRRQFALNEFVRRSPTDPRVQTIRTLLAEILWELRLRRPGYRLMAEASVLRLLGHMVRDVPSKLGPPPPPLAKDESDELSASASSASSRISRRTAPNR